MKKQLIFMLCHRLIIIFISLAVTVSCSQISRSYFSVTSSAPAKTEKPQIVSTATPGTIQTLPTEVTSQFETLCANKENSVESFPGLEGSLLLNTTAGVIALDVISFKTKPLGINGNFIKFSFTGDAVADYVDNNTTEVRFITENQDVEFSLPENSNLYGFLENGNLLVGADSNYRNNNEAATYYLISSTGEIKSNSVNLPKFYEEDIAFTQYSPNFMYIMYPQKNSGKSATAVLNIENGKLAIIDKWLMAATKFGPFPVWMPNSKAVTAVLANRDQLSQARNYFNIFPDGQVAQLTHLEDIINGDYDLFHTPMWSPNSRYLIIPISLHEKNIKTLFVFDRETETVIDTCILWKQPLYVPLAWSPNSKYFAMQADNGNKITIVNVENGETYELVVKDVSNIGLLGWVNWGIP